MGINTDEYFQKATMVFVCYGPDYVLSKNFIGVFVQSESKVMLLSRLINNECLRNK